MFLVTILTSLPSSSPGVWKATIFKPDWFMFGQVMLDILLFCVPFYQVNVQLSLQMTLQDLGCCRRWHAMQVFWVFRQYNMISIKLLTIIFGNKFKYFQINSFIQIYGISCYLSVGFFNEQSRYNQQSDSRSRKVN